MSPVKDTEPAMLDTAAILAEAEARRAEAKRLAEEKQAERNRKFEEIMQQTSTAFDEEAGSVPVIDKIFA